MYNCVKCGARGIYRRGSVTGNHVAEYKQLEAKINASTVVELKHSRRRKVCLSCLRRLFGCLHRAAA